MKRLDRLQWCPTWMSFVGALKGCSDHLGNKASLPWIYGATGRAFVINLSDDMCPSNPTLWGSMDLDKEMALNVGLDIDRIGRSQNEEGFEQCRSQVWDMTKSAIDEGLPVFGWELVTPEYYVINGYDEIGYYYHGLESGGPLPWQELANTDIGWLDIGVVRSIEPPNDIEAVKEALEFAVAVSADPNPWIHDFCHCGPGAYDTWVKSLQQGKANSHGAAYNAAVWSEARENAVAFLREAKGRLSQEHAALFDQAIGHYTVVRNMLKEVTQIFPLHGMQPEHVQDESRCLQAGTYLAAARDAEVAGLVVLERLLQAL